MTTAKAAATQTATAAQWAAQWAARAVALADARHLTGTARAIGQSARGHELYAVPSADRTRTHIVRYDAHSDATSCDCDAGKWGRACCHAGAVLFFLHMRAAALAATAETFDSFRHNSGGW